MQENNKGIENLLQEDFSFCRKLKYFWGKFVDLRNLGK